MSDLPSHPNETGLDFWDKISQFDPFLQPNSNNFGEDEDAEFASQIKYSNANISMDVPLFIHDENGCYINCLEEILNFGDGNLAESSTGLIDSKADQNSSTSNFIETDITNSLFKANYTSDFVDAPSTSQSTDVEPEEACFVQIKKSPSKRTEGHYKAVGDVIVTKHFLAEKKGKRIKFQTKEVINHGETVTISMTARKLEDKVANNPIDQAKIPEKSQCGCFSLHEESPFCVVSDEATIEWVRLIDDNFVVVLRPVKRDKLEFNIGIYKNFGKNFAAQLEFQLERDGKTLRQKYFVKAYALLGRGLTTFAMEVNSNFPDRFKWFEKGSVCEDDEPRWKKIRLSQEEEPAQINSLRVQFPTDNTIELLNLLKDDSQYQYLRL